MNDLVTTSTQLKIYDIQESVLSEFREAEKIKCEDSESRKMLGKFRADAKSIRSKVEKARLAKNREQTTLNNDAAKAINDRLTASIDAYDAEIKPYDQIAIDKANERKREEKKRIEAIAEQLESLTKLCATAMEFNISSDHIRFRIEMISNFVVDEETFQDSFGQADILKISGLAQAKAALESRIKWEEQQAENERIRIENEAKEKELEDEKEKIRIENEKRQAELDRIEKDREEKARFAREESTRKEAEAKAKADKESAELKAKEEAIKAREDAVKEKERAAAAKAELEKRIAWATEMFEAKEIEIEERRQSDWCDAIKENDIFDAAWSIAKDIDCEIKKEALKSDAERAKMVAADKKIIQSAVTNIDTLLSGVVRPKCNTDYAEAIMLELHESIKVALDVAEKSGNILV